jgi:RimJ/RimL family protein N-acetyltransferase
MDNNSNYLFKSERLGFRQFIDSDLGKMIEINSDPLVMEYFPFLPSAEQTVEFIQKMKIQFDKKGFCYFAVDKLENKEFIGFIGLSEPTFESDFTPCIDIGWRLKSSAWNKGFATEGAKACLEYGFEKLKIKTINSIAPIVNEKSTIVMEKIGMKKVKNFNHPLLKDYPYLEGCVLYEILQSPPLRRGIKGEDS